MDCGFYYDVIYYFDWQPKSCTLAALSLVLMGMGKVAFRHLALYLCWQLQNPELSVTAGKDLRSSTHSLSPMQLFFLYHCLLSQCSSLLCSSNQNHARTSPKSHRSSRGNSFTSRDNAFAENCNTMPENLNKQKEIILKTACFKLVKLVLQQVKQWWRCCGYIFLPLTLSSFLCTHNHPASPLNKRRKAGCSLKLNQLKCTLCRTRICGHHCKFHLAMVCLSKH